MYTYALVLLCTILIRRLKMQILSFKQSKVTSHYFVISASLLLLFFITPLSAFAHGDSSIDTLRRMGRAFADIAEKASPAVVGVKVVKIVTQDYSETYDRPSGDQFNPFEDDFFEFFFRRRSPHRRSPQPKSRQLAQGSGFIISPDGYILTNNHLVGEAEKVMVKLADEPEMEAKVIGTDPESDVAVIKIEADNLVYLELADSDTLEVGEWVIAIGNPFGLSHTVTAGIVSAKGRSGVGLATYEDFIQTDAAINPGNSGGPLLNLDGKAVGINTAIITGHLAHRGNVGIGFAIPINMARSVYSQLIESGTVIRGFLGVGNQDLYPELAEFFGLENTKGVVITEIVKESAAEKTGLKPGDVIVEFNGQPVGKADMFRNRVAMIKPGTKVKIVVLRDGKRKTFSVKLDERPKRGQVAGAKSETLKQLGLTVQELTDDLAKKLGYKDKDLSGVVVADVEPGSEAARKGIRQWMLIMAVNRKQVSNTKEFNEAVEYAAKAGGVLVLLVNNGRYNQFVVLELPKK